MAESVHQVKVPLYCRNGRPSGELRIAGPSPINGQPPIIILDTVEAKYWHEQPIQLLEGLSYDYEILHSSSGSRMREGVIRRSPLSTGDLERGRIEPGSHTGALTLTLESPSGEHLAEALVEVRSRKLGYREQYRRMMEELADQALKLLTDITSPSGTWMSLDERNANDSLVQRFFFVRRLALSPEFRGAVTRIASNPHEATTQTVEERSTGRGLRGSARLLVQLATGQPRSRVPSEHPVRHRLSSIPRQVWVPRSQPSRDTRENRFVKFVLRSLDGFVAELDRVLAASGVTAYRHVRSQCAELREELQKLMALGLFRDVGDEIPILPLGSPTLQRRAGYREVLRAWMQFHLASRLTWDGGDDVFLVGKRDVAQLYEYWVFFQILDVVGRKFDMDTRPVQSLIEKTAAGLSFRLKSGRKLNVFGRWRHGSKVYRIRLSYNRTFSRQPNPAGDLETSYPNSGSWTRSMRPDYVLSVWPGDLSENVAEAAGSIVHLHFDAKYRVEQMTDLFGEEGDDSNDDDSIQSTVTARRSDLLKMHAYRDAIRRSASAFVIYPGSENRRWRAYTELLPGLGAIALVPGDPTGQEVLAEFISEAVNLIASDQAT